jgi:dipeptidyl aminopeptidase/acylaminoacyl peptidase
MAGLNSMTVRRCLLAVLGIVALVLALSSVAAAVLAEGSVHPILKRRSSDTAALAYSIADASRATARKVTITTSDGVRLNAWWLSPPESNGRGVIVCHGVADSAFGALGYALLFLNHGYSVLVPESRGHGESLGFVTYGVLESGDIVRWLSWIKGNGVSDVFGFGESLGGAILIQSLAQGAPFRAVVAECPYSSFEAVADERVARVIPAPLASLLVKEGIAYVYIRYGVNLFHARPDVAIARVQVPILLIHGQADNETSPENSIRLAQVNPAFTTLWLVPGAKHTGAYAENPKAFEARVLQRFGDLPAPHFGAMWKK